MICIAWGLAAFATAALIGQYLVGQADLFISMANPRPLDEEQMVVVITWWGLAFQAPQPFVTTQSDLGLADVRIFATRKQVLVAIFTLGIRRPLTVAWRGHAGIVPMGNA